MQILENYFVFLHGRGALSNEKQISERCSARSYRNGCRFLTRYILPVEPESPDYRCILSIQDIPPPHTKKIHRCQIGGARRPVYGRLLWKSITFLHFYYLISSTLHWMLTEFFIKNYCNPYFLDFIPGQFQDTPYTRTLYQSTSRSVCPTNLNISGDKKDNI